MYIDRFIVLLSLANFLLIVLLVYSHIHMIKCILELLTAIEEIEELEEEDE